MNYDNLVNLIVEEIYKKLNVGESISSNKPKAVTIFEENSNKFDLLKDEFEIVGFDKSIRDCEVVIVSKLCIRGLSNLALGNSTSEEERFILKMIMKGRKVYILDEGIEYKRYKETAPKALYKKFMSFEDEICKFGVDIVKDLKTISNNNQSKKKESINNLELRKENIKTLNTDEKKSSSIEIDDEFSLDLRNKKLISEADLRKPIINGVKNVLVNKQTIITPLATDFLKIHHIKLKRM